MVLGKGGTVRRSGTEKERGASLVEFALVAPLLIMLVLGIVDFAWILSTQQDVRHGAREAARLAAVNTDNAANMAALVCNAMNFSTGATVTFDAGAGDIGSTGTVSVVSPVTSLTGFSSLPFANSIYPTTFTESIQFRLEQIATNWPGVGGGSCP
jgi:Flp pilus assembly protein TadG